MASMLVFYVVCYRQPFCLPDVPIIIIIIICSGCAPKHVVYDTFFPPSNFSTVFFPWNAINFLPCPWRHQNMIIATTIGLHVFLNLWNVTHPCQHAMHLFCVLFLVHFPSCVFICRSVTRVSIVKHLSWMCFMLLISPSFSTAFEFFTSLLFKKEKNIIRLAYGQMNVLHEELNLKYLPTCNE